MRNNSTKELVERAGFNEYFPFLKYTNRHLHAGIRYPLRALRTFVVYLLLGVASTLSEAAGQRPQVPSSRKRSPWTFRVRRFRPLTGR